MYKLLIDCQRHSLATFICLMGVAWLVVRVVVPHPKGHWFDPHSPCVCVFEHITELLIAPRRCSVAAHCPLMLERILIEDGSNAQQYFPHGGIKYLKKYVPYNNNNNITTLVQTPKSLVKYFYLFS